MPWELRPQPQGPLHGTLAPHGTVLPRSLLASLRLESDFASEGAEAALAFSLQSEVLNAWSISESLQLALIPVLSVGCLVTGLGCCGDFRSLHGDDGFAGLMHSKGVAATRMQAFATGTTLGA